MTTVWTLVRTFLNFLVKTVQDVVKLVEIGRNNGQDNFGTLAGTLVISLALSKSLINVLMMRMYKDEKIPKILQ